MEPRNGRMPESDVDAGAKDDGGADSDFAPAADADDDEEDDAAPPAGHVYTVPWCIRRLLLLIVTVFCSDRNKTQPA